MSKKKILKATVLEYARGQELVKDFLRTRNHSRLELVLKTILLNRYFFSCFKDEEN